MENSEWKQKPWWKRRHYTRFCVRFKPKFKDEIALVLRLVNDPDTPAEFIPSLLEDGWRSYWKRPQDFMKDNNTEDKRNN